MSKVKQMVDAKIGGKKVVVFSKSWCPYCNKAKKILEKYNPDDMEYVEIEDMPECAEIQDYLQSITGGRSVPRIFISGKSYGGCDDITALDSKGQLKPLL